MRIILTERFQRDVGALSADQRATLLEVLLTLPSAIGNPHNHSGLGIRKLHPSGIWEARLGLGLRMVFAFGDGALTLARVGTHDDIRRYLRSI